MAEQWPALYIKMFHSKKEYNFESKLVNKTYDKFNFPKLYMSIEISIYILSSNIRTKLVFNINIRNCRTN